MQFYLNKIKNWNLVIFLNILFFYIFHVSPNTFGFFIAWIKVDGFERYFASSQHIKIKHILEKNYYYDLFYVHFLPAKKINLVHNKYV